MAGKAGPRWQRPAARLNWRRSRPTKRAAGWKAHEMGDTVDVGDAVADELIFDPDVDASDITVRTVNGKVALAGSVPSYPEYLAAVADARRIAGVRNVRNDLE